MESLTKNRQDKKVLSKMVEKCFAPIWMVGYRELTEGYFNVAYEIKLSDGRNVILKIAPDKKMRIMTYEKDIMHSEIEAMERVALDEHILAPKLLGKDESCTICNSPYFFMEKLEGESLNAIKASLDEETIHKIYMETGKMIRLVNDIECPCFGYPSQKAFQGTDWFHVFYKMVEQGLMDAKAGRVDLKIEVDEVLPCLERDKAYFKEVTKPKLVHWDCWDGNIFVKDGKVTGIIDWERCIWADSLMEVNFRTYGDDKWFKKGYGLEVFTQHQYRRAIWYDIYALILMSLECEYRHYGDMGMYDWATGLLVKKFAEISILVSR